MTGAEIKTERLYQNLFHDMKELIPFLEDKAVTDISLLGSGEVVVKKMGFGKIFTGIYLNEENIKRILLGCASILGIPINTKLIPKLEGVLPKYNARITGLLAPWVQKPELTIRKPSEIIFTLEDYLNREQISKENYEKVIKAIRERKNILIGGATGSGKSTFLNAILQKMVELTPNERFYIVEDIPELQCKARDASFLWVQPEQAVEAVRTALRWSPNRIIFGELRYGEVASELLKSWNTGHTGNATTIHADSAESMIRRVEALLSEVIVGTLPDISQSIHLCIHLIGSSNGPQINEIRFTNEIKEKLDETIRKEKTA